MKSPHRLLSIGAPLLLFGPFLHAQPYNIANNGNWGTSATWTPNTSANGPTAADSIQISGLSAIRTVNLTGLPSGDTFTVSSLTYNDTYSVSFANSGYGQRYLTISGDLTKNGTGSLSFQQTANGSPTDLRVEGDVRVNEGTLNLGTGSNAITAVRFLGSTTVSSGAILNLGIYYGSGTTFQMGAMNVNGQFRLSGGNAGGSNRAISLTSLAGSGEVSVYNDFTSARTVTWDFSLASGSAVYSGSFSQSTNMVFNLQHSGAGRQAFTGTLAYTGTTLISGGGVLQFGNNTATTVGSGNLSISGGTSANGGSILGLGNSSGSFTRTVTATPGTNNLQMSGYAGFAAYGINQSVTLNGGAALTWNSGGFLTGTSALVLGHSTATAQVTLTNDLSFNGVNRTMLVHDGSAAIDGTLSGILTDGGGTRSLTKEGAGTLELTGNNTFSGGTIISAGTLLVNNTNAGSATGSGAVTLSAGATLGGGNASATTGFISGLVTTGGTTSVLNPGTNGAGTLTLTSGLNAAAGATFNFQLGLTSDRIHLGAFTGSTAANGLVFNFADAGGLMAGVAYTLLDYTTATGLDYGDLIANSIASGFTLDTGFGTNGFLIDPTNGLLQVQFAAIPEPASLALLLGGLAGLLIRKSRTRNA